MHNPSDGTIDQAGSMGESLPRDNHWAWGGHVTDTRPMKVRWRTSARAVGSKRLIFTEVAKKIEQKPGAASGHLCPYPRDVCPRVKAT